MVSAVAALLIVLNTLARFSQGYAIDESCYRSPFGQAVADRVEYAMAEGKEALNLAHDHVTIDPRDEAHGGDDMDNTRNRLFEVIDPEFGQNIASPGQPQKEPEEMIAGQLAFAQRTAQPKHSPILPMYI
jgi:hypothetical protein